MTVNELVPLVALVVSVVGWAQTYFAARERFAKLELKTDTMWDFQMRRAQAEAEHLQRRIEAGLAYPVPPPPRSTPYAA